MAHFLSCGENVSNLTIVASSFATLALARIGRWRPAPYVRFGSIAAVISMPGCGSCGGRFAGGERRRGLSKFELGPR